MNNKITLNNIVLLRVVAIIGVVVYHSFSAVYNINNSNELQNFIFNQGFMIMGLNMAMIPLFTFISGYLFSYTNKSKSFLYLLLVRQKFQRLIIPYCIFSVFFFIVTPHVESFSAKELLLNFFRGSDHLWFLLMLFSCFLIFGLIKEYKWGSLCLIFIYILYFIIENSHYSMLNKLFAFKGFILFFPWFCVGYWVQKIQNKIYNQTVFITTIIIYLSIIGYSLCNKIYFGGFVDIYTSYICQLLIIIFTLIGTTYISLPSNSLINIVVSKINYYSFGIYIFHMWFIHLISKASFFKNISNEYAYQAPVTFSIAIFLFSFLLAYFVTILFKRTQLGNKILG